jgi:hypothetical protein
MSLTRKGIAYDFYESPYHFTNERGVTFIFSSAMYKQKFIRQLHENRKALNDSVTRRLGIELNLINAFDLSMYLKIEKRGFLLRLESGEYLCRSQVKLNGDNVTKIEQISK